MYIYIYKQYMCISMQISAGSTTLPRLPLWGASGCVEIRRWRRPGENSTSSVDLEAMKP